MSSASGGPGKPSGTPPPDEPPDEPPAVATPAEDGAGVGRSSAVMAAGTILSRLTGFARDLVLTWAIGVAVFADTYSVANTIPNVIYILLAGGVLNAVFVPQLVKAMRNDADGGKAFADRLLTAVGLVLVVITVAAVLAAPLVIRAYATAFTRGDLEGDFDVAVTFARYFLPQIFFYGLHVMIGQVLNARGRFGPMMFTPILNNLVVIGTGVLFLTATHGDTPTAATVTPGEIRLLGIGTTLGVVVQALALIPSLRKARYSYRPRFDLRGTGLGTAYRLAGWTLLFVLINQVAYLAIVQFSTTAGANDPGHGFAPYTKAYLIMLLPHAVVTVSVVTALLPRMSRAVADGRPSDMRTDLAGGLKLTGSALVPAAVAFAVLGPSMAITMYAYGNTAVADAEFIGYVLSAFGLGLIPFSVHHQLLRGFYALEDTRTPVTVNVWIAATNISLGLLCAWLLPARWVVVGLAASYSLSYVVGVALSARRLGRRIGRVGNGVVRTYNRLIFASVFAAGPALVVSGLARRHWGTGHTAALVGLLGGGALMLATFLVLAARMHIRDVTDLLATLTRRVRR